MQVSNLARSHPSLVNLFQTLPLFSVVFNRTAFKTSLSAITYDGNPHSISRHRECGSHRVICPYVDESLNLHRSRDIFMEYLTCFEWVLWFFCEITKQREKTLPFDFLADDFNCLRFFVLNFLILKVTSYFFPCCDSDIFSWSPNDFSWLSLG